MEGHRAVLLLVNFGPMLDDIFLLVSSQTEGDEEGVGRVLHLDAGEGNVGIDGPGAMPDMD